MAAAGHSVIRFWNADVLKHKADVCATLLAAPESRFR